MAITPFVSDIEMNKNIIYNPCFHVSSEDIANPRNSQYYLNSSDDKVYFYKASENKWIKVGDNSIIYTAGAGINISNENVISVQDTIFENIQKNASDIAFGDKEISANQKASVEASGILEINIMSSGSSATGRLI